MISRLVQFVLLATQLVVATGVPLVVPSLSPLGDMRGDERYPCEKCRCGCVSAEQCWRSCCCFSLDERLAWAERNGVKPPDWVVKKGTTTRRTKVDKQDASVRAVADSPVKVRRAVAPCGSGRSCCHSDSCVAKADAKSAIDVSSPAGKSVSILRSLQCRGLSMLLAMVSIGIVPEQFLISDVSSFNSNVVLVAKSAYQSPRLDIVTPPPRDLA